jgi:hypothetical protein
MFVYSASETNVLSTYLLIVFSFQMTGGRSLFMRPRPHRLTIVHTSGPHEPMPGQPVAALLRTRAAGEFVFHHGCTPRLFGRAAHERPALRYEPAALRAKLIGAILRR